MPGDSRRISREEVWRGGAEGMRSCRARKYSRMKCFMRRPADKFNEANKRNMGIFRVGARKQV
eukprot:1393724-Amorphochlora_amoeboformis.AAC.1